MARSEQPSQWFEIAAHYIDTRRDSSLDVITFPGDNAQVFQTVSSHEGQPHPLAGATMILRDLESHSDTAKKSHTHEILDSTKGQNGLMIVVLAHAALRGYKGRLVTATPTEQPKLEVYKDILGFQDAGPDQLESDRGRASALAAKVLGLHHIRFTLRFTVPDGLSKPSTVPVPAEWLEEVHE